jgi:hypothetical protein
MNVVLTVPFLLRTNADPITQISTAIMVILRNYDLRIYSGWMASSRVRVTVVDITFGKNPSTRSKVIRRDWNVDDTTTLLFVIITESVLRR